MSGDIAAWQATLPERCRYGIVQALRQTLAAAVRWRYMVENPTKQAGPNREPTPRKIRVYTREELETIAEELPPTYAALPLFAASTGLRPEERAALERRDIDRRGRVLSVLRTVSSGAIVEAAKTKGGRRQVPLSDRAFQALHMMPPRIDSPYLFPSPTGELLNVNNFRRRVWAPAIEAGGIRTPARLYDLRSTFASEALSVGISIFELARIMGTSPRMIERHYGALLDGALEGIPARLNTLSGGLGV